MSSTRRDLDNLATQTTAAVRSNPGNPSVQKELGQHTPRPTAAGIVFHHHELTSIHNRPALKVYMTGAHGNPQTLTFFYQPRSGIKLKLGRIPRCQPRHAIGEDSCKLERPAASP